MVRVIEVAYTVPPALACRHTRQDVVPLIRRPPLTSRQKREALRVSGANNGEATPVCGQNISRFKSFGDSHDAGVHKSQWQIRVLVNERRRAHKILRIGWLYRELVVRQRLNERQFRGGTNARLEEIADLGQHGDGYDDGA